MLKDVVFCNWCEQTAGVEREADQCPNCKEEGFLSDVIQDVIIPNSR